jgi:hypothetical protein
MKAGFRTNKPDNFSIISSFHERDSFWMDPPYQRQSDIWPPEKRQLLLDSLLNGFDLPKLYLHEFYPDKTVKGKTYKYAVVDGKQRLSTIWKFLSNDLPLSDDFVFFREPEKKLARLTHRELGEQFPIIRDTFNAITLPVVTILTEDIELIEEMFSRLNDGVPLNAAEKRNTFGGPAPLAIRKLATHKFLATKLPFTNRRYRHFDLSAKFLFFAAHNNEARDSKKAYLDEFVLDCKPNGAAKVENARKSATEVLERMAKLFVAKDELLQSVAMVTLYYLLIAKRNDVKRKALADFEALRAENRAIAEKDITKGKYELLEFDRYSQSPNDAIAMRFRLKVINGFLDKH